MSDWQDPFAEDEAARERAERRAARERKRQEETTRESLGERVRQELGQEPAAPHPPNPPEAGETSERPSQPPEPEPAGAPPAAEAIPPPPEAEFAPGPVSPPPPPPRRPSAAAVHKRRMVALFGVAVLILGVAVAGTVLSRDGGESEVPAGPKAKKTFEFVVPEGFDRNQIAELAKKEGLKGDYMKATQSFKGFDLKKFGAEDAESLEGFLFPATYELFEGATVEDLIEKQLEAFEANLAEAGVNAAEKRGFTPYEVVIIASMIEREIAVAEERELAASVIYNRLEEGSPLGIDATIRFEDQNYSGQLLLSRLNEDTPYNTRLNAGLPPGPIGNPGLASLEAAANPVDTEFFYFVVKPGSCNEHTFVETEAEFAEAEAEYQAALQAQGNSPTEC